MAGKTATSNVTHERITRRRFLEWGAGVTGFAVLSACAPSAPTASGAPSAAATVGTPKSGGQVVYATQGEGTGLDPAQNILGTDLEAQQQVFEGLVRYKTATLEELRGGAGLGGYEPALAESWSPSADNLVWTFKLRRGVMFHDGTPFNADAVVTSFDRILNKSNPYYFAGKTRAGGQLGIAFKSFRAVEPYTFELTLSRRYATLFDVLSHGESSIVSPAALQKYGPDFSTHPVGTGAFRFVEWVKNDHTTFERNPDWWGGKTYLDRLIFRPVPDPTVRLAMIERGEADFQEGVPPDDIDRVLANKDLVVTQLPSGINGVWMNNQRKPFDDVRVRQALNYAIDRAELHKTLYKNLGDLVSSPLVKTTPYFDTALKPWPFDPDKAKQLLTEAGYASGFDADMVTVNAAFLFNPIGGPKLAEAIQSYLAKVNVRGKIRVIEEAAQTAIRSAGTYDLMVGNGAGAQTDPDRALFPVYHSGEWTRRNVTRYKNTKVDELIISGQQEFDTQKRAVIYKEAQGLIYNDAPWIWLNVPTDSLVARKPINAVQVATSIHRRFYGTWRS